MRLVPHLPRAASAAVLAAMLLVSPALAHADLVSSDPEDGAVLGTPPTTVTLTFSEGLDAGKSSARLIGSGGEAATGRPAKDGAKTIELTDLALEPGAYTVKWVAAAEDGHIERGELGFTVDQATLPPATSSPTPSAAATDTATASPTTPPATAAPTDPPAATSVADPAPAAAEGSTTDVILPIALGLLLVAGVGLFVVRRSRSA